MSKYLTTIVFSSSLCKNIKIVANFLFNFIMVYSELFFWLIWHHLERFKKNAYCLWPLLWLEYYYTRLAGGPRGRYTMVRILKCTKHSINCNIIFNSNNEIALEKHFWTKFVQYFSKYYLHQICMSIYFCVLSHYIYKFQVFIELIFFYTQKTLVKVIIKTFLIANQLWKTKITIYNQTHFIEHKWYFSIITWKNYYRINIWNVFLRKCSKDAINIVLHQHNKIILFMFFMFTIAMTPL